MQLLLSSQLFKSTPDNWFSLINHTFAFCPNLIDLQILIGDQQIGIRLNRDTAFAPAQAKERCQIDTEKMQRLRQRHTGCDALFEVFINRADGSYANTDKIMIGIK